MINEKQAIVDNKIMKLLGVTEIRHRIALTNHGELTLMLRLGEDASSYHYVLDAVPLDEDKNSELKELLNR